MTIGVGVCHRQVAEQTGQSKLPATETATEVDPQAIAERQVGCSLNVATAMSADNNVNPSHLSVA